MEIPILIVLIIASGFFSGSETAFISLDKFRIKQIEEMNTAPSRRVIRLLSDPYKLLVTILLGNTMVNIAASSLMTKLFYLKLGEKGVGISIVVMTVVILIFGEFTPKMFSLSNAKKVAFLSSPLLAIIEKLLTPLRVVLVKFSGMIVRGMGFRASPEKHRITEQEIRSLFSMSTKRGIVKEKEKDMVESILQFKDLNAADIMTPRIDIEALDLTLKRNDIVEKIKETQFSRYPVYVHTLDNIVGVIHSKDFLLNETVSVNDLVRRPVFAPESMRIDDLLNELQEKNVHMGVVTDEYGVTSGVITIEDILEEIVGEIRDEFDFESPNILRKDRKSYEILGQTHIDEVNERLGLNIETEEVDTIGGYVTLIMGRLPQAGDKVKIGRYLFWVNDLSKNRITSLTVERTARNKKDKEKE